MTFVMKNIKFLLILVAFVSGCALEKADCVKQESTIEKKTQEVKIGSDEIAVVDGKPAFSSKKVLMVEGKVNGGDLATRELGTHALGLMSEGSDFSNLKFVRGFDNDKCVILQIGDTLNCDELVVGEAGKKTALSLVGDSININIDDTFSVKGEKTTLEFIADAVGISTIRTKKVGAFEGSLIIDISMHHSFKGFERRYILIAAENGDWAKQLGDLSDLDKNPKIKVLKKHHDDEVKLYVSPIGELVLTFIMGGDV